MFLIFCIYTFLYTFLFIPFCFLVVKAWLYPPMIHYLGRLAFTYSYISTLGIIMQYLFYIFFYILLNAYICIIPLNKASPQEKRPHIRPCNAFYKLGMTLYTSLLKIFNVAKYHNNRGKRKSRGPRPY